MDGWDGLPDEVWENVFVMLNDKMLMALTAPVCHRWAAMSSKLTSALTVSMTNDAADWARTLKSFQALQTLKIKARPVRKRPADGHGYPRPTPEVEAGYVALLHSLQGTKLLRSLDLSEYYLRLTTEALEALGMLTHLNCLSFGSDTATSPSIAVCLDNPHLAPALACLTNLTSLDLSFCTGNISNFEPIAPLSPVLKHLSFIQCTNLSEAGLRTLPPLEALETLNLSNCFKLTDTSMSSLPDLRNLQSLRVGCGFNLTDTSPLARFTSLTQLDLMYWQMTDHSLSGLLSCLTRMKNLDISNCASLTNEALRAVAQMQNLETLDLWEDDGIDDGGLALLSTHAEIRTLRISSCNVSCEGLRHLPSSLSSLTFKPDQLLSPNWLLELSHLTALTRLEVNSAPGRLTNCHHLGSLAQLQSLHLQDCEMNDADISAALGGLGALTSLELQPDIYSAGCNFITESGMSALAALTNVRTLDLGAVSELSDQMLLRLCCITGLTSLSVGGHSPPAESHPTALPGCGNVTSAGVSALSTMTNLTSLKVLRCKELRCEQLGSLSSLSRLKTLRLTAGNVHPCRETLRTLWQRCPDLIDMKVKQC